MSISSKFIAALLMCSIFIVNAASALENENATYSDLFIEGILHDISKSIDDRCGLAKNPECTQSKCTDSKGESGTCMIVIRDTRASCECVTVIGGEEEQGN